MRARTYVLIEALTGHFEDHHAFLATRMVHRVDALSADVEAVGARVEALIAPCGHHVQCLDETTGVGRTAAQELIAEIGVDMSRFPTALQLVSWASSP